MTWTLLLGLVVVLGLALFASIARRAELVDMRRHVAERERATRTGTAKAQLQHPVVDLSRCLGCGTCVASCPEDGVLELVHGQAMVVKGARCQGISACERECPVGAITVTLGNVEEREDIPALTEELEAVGSPGVFLAGEVTAHALIKTAVEHGTAVAAEVARRRDSLNGNGTHAVESPLDLLIVGAGPAGLACSLEAKRRGLRFLTIDQEDEPGGTVAKYPRQKLVMTQPIELPLHGRLKRSSYAKEELIDLWRGIAVSEELPIRGGEVFRGLESAPGGAYVVKTESSTYSASNVCLALGRRGVPRRLGVPGEELPKVAYSLLDAHSYRDRRILVVGGGDSAVESALGLADQPGNEVTLSYRGDEFSRIRSKNEQRIAAETAAGRLRVIYRSEVRGIHPNTVDLVVQAEGGISEVSLPNDDVFVMAGGVPPFELLEQSGVSFDSEQRIKAPELVEQGSGLVRALWLGFGLALFALAWAALHADYYTLARHDRPAHVKHDFLRPGMGAGLAFGIAASVSILLNLLYLARRSPRFRFDLGSLQVWMTSHVATGIFAVLCAVLHAAMAPRSTPGGHAFWALFVLLITGAIGRYFYAYVPRAANGRELELAEVKARLARMSDQWDQGQQRFRARARDEVFALIESRQWRSSLVGRVLALLGVNVELKRLLERLRIEGEAEGLAAEQVAETLRLARRAHRTALMAAHYEDLRAVLNTWRFLHRWMAALMILLVIVHVVYALSYGSFFEGRES